MKNQQNIASISIEGSLVEKNRIPTDVLDRIIAGFQKITWMLGTASEGTAYWEDFRRIPADLKKKYMIQWGVSTPGSYVLNLYPPREQNTDASILSILMAFAANNLDELKRLLPDSRFRSKIFKEALNFLPRGGESWQLKYTHKQHSASLDIASSRKIKIWFNESIAKSQLDEVLTIKGELLRIDFEAKRVVVRYLPTHRSIECYYIPEIEDSILESRRELIEVTGRFVLNREGHPERLTEVTTIQPVDLSPMTLS